MSLVVSLATMFGLSLVPGQPILNTQSPFRPQTGTGIANLRITSQSPDGTELVLTMDYTYDGRAGPTAFLVPLIEKRGQRGVSAWFGADPVTVGTGSGLVSIKVKYFNDEPGVPAEFTSDSLRILVLNRGETAILSSIPFLKTIKWGNAAFPPATLSSAPAAENAKAEARAQETERQEAELEAEKLARETARRLAEQNARDEARRKTELNALRLADERRQAEEKAKAQALARAEARQKAADEAKARREAEAKAKVEATAREVARKKAEAEANRLAKEKRAAEAKARAEARANEKARLLAQAKEREEAQKRAEAEAKRLAEERRIAEEKARVESAQREDARRRAEAEEKARLAAEAKEKEEAAVREKARVQAETEAKRLAEAKKLAEQKARPTPAGTAPETATAARPESLIPALEAIATSLKTKITNVDVVNRSLDRTRMTIGVEYDYKDSLGPKPMLGVDVTKLEEPAASRYFESQPAEIGRSRRNFVLFPVKFQPPSSLDNRGTFTTDRVLVYLMEATSAKRFNLFPTTMLLLWRAPGATSPGTVASESDNFLQLDDFKQTDPHTGYITVKYHLLAGPGKLRMRIFDAARPASAEWFITGLKTVPTGRGLELLDIMVNSKAKTTTPIFSANRLEIELMDSTGKVVARFAKELPMTWAKPD